MVQTEQNHRRGLGCHSLNTHNAGYTKTTIPTNAGLPTRQGTPRRRYTMGKTILGSETQYRSGRGSNRNTRRLPRSTTIQLDTITSLQSIFPLQRQCMHKQHDTNNGEPHQRTTNADILEAKTWMERDGPTRHRLGRIQRSNATIPNHRDSIHQ